MTRRQVLQVVAAATAAAPLESAPRSRGWAGYLTSAMAVDDVRRLLVVDTRAPKALRSAVLKHGELARLGCGLPKPSGPVSTAWPAAGRVTTDERIAIGAGAWIASVVNEALSVAPDPLALDAALLAARHPSAARLSKEAYLDYLRAMDLRCQIELHTLDPEETDIHAWLEGTAAWYRESQEYLDALAGALAAGAGSPAFDPADPLFRLAERIRRAESVQRDAFAQARPSSTYGKALAAALDRLAG
jgi:hypothetical protein